MQSLLVMQMNTLIVELVQLPKNPGLNRSSMKRYGVNLGGGIYSTEILCLSRVD